MSKRQRTMISNVVLVINQLQESNASIFGAVDVSLKF